jgi:hypothetical protein
MRDELRHRTTAVASGPAVSGGYRFTADGHLT